MRTGDLVRAAFYETKWTYVLGVIVGVVGDDNVILMDDAGNTSQPLLSSLKRPVMSPALRKQRQSIIAHSRTAEGKAAIKASRSAAGDIYRRVKLTDTRLTRIPAPPEEPPPSGTGSPDHRFPPLVLAQSAGGFRSSAWATGFEAYLCFWEGRAYKGVQYLAQHHPVLFDTLDLVERCGLKPQEAANALHVTPRLVRDRLYLARKIVRDRAGTPDELEAKYNATRGASCDAA